MKKNQLSGIVWVLFCIEFLFAQNLPNDCVNYIQACGNQDISYNVSGAGVQEIIPFVCSSQEHNSLWLRVTVETAGTLGFTLTPGSTSIVEDYDFWVFGPNVNCNNLGSAIRCSTTNPQSANQGNNLTGMNGTETDTQEGPGQNGNSFVKWLTVNAGDSYFIVIDRPIGNSAFSLQWTGTAQIGNPFTGLTFNDFPDVELCDANLNGTETFDFSTLSANYLNGNTGFTIDYFNTEDNANLDVNPFLSPQTISPGTYWARIEHTTSGCFEVYGIEVDFVTVQVQNQTEVVCDNDNDGTAQINLSTLQHSVSPSNTYTFSYFNSQTDAETLSNPLSDPHSFSSNKTVFVRADNPDGCFGIGQLQLEIHPEIVMNAVSDVVCDDTTDGVFGVDLNTYNSQMYSGTESLTYSYHTQLIDAQMGQNPVSSPVTINQSQSFFVRGENSLGCFGIGTLDITVNPLIELNDIAELLCDNDQNGLENIILSNYESSLYTGTETLSLSYHLSLSDAENNQNAQTNNFAVTQTQTLFVRGENEHGCYGISEFNISLEPGVQLLDIDVFNCDDNLDGMANDNLQNYESQIYTGSDVLAFTYHTTQSDAENGLNPINPQITYIDGESVFVRAINEFGCIGIAEISLHINAVVAVTDITEALCEDDGDGSVPIDLVQYQNQIYVGTDTVLFSYYSSLLDAENQTNPINSTQNVPVGTTTYFVRVENESCHQIAQIEIEIYPKPDLGSDEILYKCPEDDITLSVAELYVSYQWDTGETVPQITVTDEGIYEITVTDANGCMDTKVFEVRNYDSPVIVQALIHNQTVTLIAQGDPTLLYSFDGSDFTLLHSFHNVEAGVYFAQVQSGNGCLSELFKVIVIEYANTITPNGDGVNDAWRIPYLEEYETAVVTIYDRYGKLMYQKTVDSPFEWDGKYLGRNVPTSAYWFHIQLPNGQVDAGWILVKSR